MYGMFYKKQIFSVLYLIENRNKNQPVSCFTEEIHLLLICVFLVQPCPGPATSLELGSVLMFTEEDKKEGSKENQAVGGNLGGGLLVIIAGADLIRHQCIELFCITSG